MPEIGGLQLLVIGVAFGVAGHFLGWRSGWRAGVESEKKRAAEAAPAQPVVETKVYDVAPVAIGTRFPYLGIEMLCVSHAVRLSPGASLPGMTAEYLDGDGVMRAYYWTPDQFDAVRAEVRRGAAKRTPHHAGEQA